MYNDECRCHCLVKRISRENLQGSLRPHLDKWLPLEKQVTLDKEHVQQLGLLLSSVKRLPDPRALPLNAWQQSPLRVPGLLPLQHRVRASLPSRKSLAAGQTVTAQPQSRLRPHHQQQLGGTTGRRLWSNLRQRAMPHLPPRQARRRSSQVLTPPNLLRLRDCTVAVPPRFHIVRM